MRKTLIVIGTASLFLLGIWFGWHGESRGAETEPGFEDINVALRMAVRESDQTKVATLLGQGADPNSDFYGQTPLLLAIQWGDLELVQTLVEAGADIHKPSLGGGSPLAGTTWASNYEMAAYLLDQGADVNAADDSGYTPLHWAVTRAGSRFVQLLLEHGADVHAYAMFGRSALDQYTADQDPEIIQLLIDYGADINQGEIGDDTPLLKSVTNIKAMQVLLDNGADINAKNYMGNTPLHEAVRNHQYIPPKNPDDPIEAIRFLVANGADIESRDNMGNTPLMNCRMEDEDGFFELLLDLGADINAMDEDGETLLHNIADSYYQHEWIPTLINLGAEAETWNQDGNKPIYDSLVLGNLELVDVLLEAGSEYDLVVASGLGDLEYITQALSDVDHSSRNAALEAKALSIAANSGQMDVVDFLLEHGVETRFVDMVRIGYLDEIQRLIDNGANMNADSESGYLPLYEAGKAGNNDVIKLLVKNGADLNAGDFLDSAISWDHFDSYQLFIHLGVDPDANFNWGRTALHSAVSFDARYVELLLEQGVDVNAVEDHMGTPLSSAAWYGNAEVVALLIAAGANLVGIGGGGWTPLTHALHGASETPTKCMELLLIAGADPDKHAEQGLTPLLNAVYTGQIAEIELLLEYGADIEYTSMYGNTALAFAISEGKDDIAVLLRKHGAQEPSEEMLWDIEHQER